MMIRTILAALAMLVMVPSAAMAEEPGASAPKVTVRAVILDSLVAEPPKGVTGLWAADQQAEREFDMQFQTLRYIRNDMMTETSPERKALLQADFEIKQAELARNYQRRQDELFKPVMAKMATEAPLFQASKGGSEIKFVTQDAVDKRDPSVAIEDLSAEAAAWMNARP